MEYNNRFNRNLARLSSVPSSMRSWFRNQAIRKIVPFTGTARIEYLKMSCGEVIVKIPNRKSNQNHIHQVHAAGTVLAAETATGMIVGLNLPDDKLPLMKSMNVRFTKRSTGDITAIASLSKSEIERIRTLEKGDVSVPVSVTDAKGVVVIEAEMIWAWIPNKKK